MSVYIFAQFLGLIGFGLFLYGVYQENDKRLKIYVALCSLVMGFHFYLLGAMMGAIIAILGAIRYFISAYYQGKILLITFIIIYLGLFFVNIEGAIGFTVLITSIIGTVAVFALKGIQMRYAFLSGQAINFIYNAYHFSIGGMCIDLLGAALHIKNIIKLKKESK